MAAGRSDIRVDLSLVVVIKPAQLNVVRQQAWMKAGEGEPVALSMIRIEVTSFNGQPPRRPIVGEFDQAGWTIGRGERSTLLLSDTKRLISRTHASIIFRDGNFVVRDLGSASPVILNGKQLGMGREAPIHDGDVLEIAGYTLHVVGVDSDPVAEIGAGTSDDDPFADLIAPPSNRSGDLSSSPNNSVPATPVERPARSEPARADRAAGEASKSFDPFEDREPPPTPGRDSINDEANFGLGARAGAQDIGKLWALDDVGAGDVLKEEQHAERNVIDPMRPSPSNIDEILGVTPSAKREAYPAQRDDASDIDTPMLLPRDRPSALPSRGHRQAARRVPVRETRPPISMPPAVAPPKPTATPFDADDLLTAFLAGAGVPNIDVQGGLTPQLMNVLGQLLHESTQGTLDLLAVRAITKRQLNADVTMIVARENNPLKFSPNVETALTHLLAPHGQGFMTPVAALKDAYGDLRSHEIGFMAGMRAALTGVLERFRPDQLERRLTQTSVLDSLLPMNRQAKLWVLFGELYAEIFKEAEDNFHSLFGREFVRAYEAQIAELEREERNDASS